MFLLLLRLDKNTSQPPPPLTFQQHFPSFTNTWQQHLTTLLPQPFLQNIRTFTKTWQQHFTTPPPLTFQQHFPTFTKTWQQHFTTPLPQTFLQHFHTFTSPLPATDSGRTACTPLYLPVQAVPPYSLLPPPFFFPVPVIVVRYNSLLWMCTLNTLTWPDLTWPDLMVLDKKHFLQHFHRLKEILLSLLL